MEMPLPKIPTDNLYKFAALTGALIWIIGYLLLTIPLINEKAIVQNAKFERRLDSLKKESMLMQNQLLNSLDSSTYLINKMDRLLKLRKHLIDSDTYKIEDMRDASNLTMRQAERYDTLRTYIYSQNTVGNKIDYYTRPNTILLGIISSFLILLGFLISAWGFLNWYYKLQRPLDHWYQKQIEEYKSPNKEIRTEDKT